MRIRLPPRLDEQRELGPGPDWGHWLDRLPRLFAELLDEWDLTRDGHDLWHGFCSLVAPVISADGTRAVLKITFDGDSESLHEALVLQRWHGEGAVRLLRADPHRRAVLLERLDRRDLTQVSDLEACQIVAGLYPKLHQPALPQLATLTSHISRWLEDLAAQPRDIPIPPRYRDQAQSLGRDLASDPTSVGRIIHGDLHYENVLATPLELRPDRGQWLAIDPKPMSGDPHYEVAPMLWNRYDELARDVRNGIQQRFHTVVEHGRLDKGSSPRLGRRPDDPQRQLVGSGRPAGRTRTEHPRARLGHPMHRDHQGRSRLKPAPDRQAPRTARPRSRPVRSQH